MYLNPDWTVDENESAIWETIARNLAARESIPVIRKYVDRQGKHYLTEEK